MTRVYNFSGGHRERGDEHPHLLPEPLHHEPAEQLRHGAGGRDLAAAAETLQADHPQEAARDAVLRGHAALQPAQEHQLRLPAAGLQPGEAAAAGGAGQRGLGLHQRELGAGLPVHRGVHRVAAAQPRHQPRPLAPRLGAERPHGKNILERF